MRITIGFSRPKKWKPFAALIMWWDRYRFKASAKMSHGFIRFSSNRWDRAFIYQSAGHRTHFMGGSYFGSINDPVEEYEIEVTDEVEARIGRLCVDREGKPYGVKQVLGSGIVNLVWLITFGKVSLKNPWEDGDAKTTCVEEVAAIICTGIGIECPLNLDSVSVWPFREWVASLPMARRIK